MSDRFNQLKDYALDVVEAVSLVALFGVSWKLTTWIVGWIVNL